MSDYKAERETMIDAQIRPNAVTDVALLAAMLEVPREAFVPPSLRSLAYIDDHLRVEAPRGDEPARFLLAPMVFARLAQLARIKAEDRVLDVGPAAGYSTAVLSKLAKRVVVVESDAGLAALAKDALAGEGIENVKLVIGPLKEGAADDGPYDVIFVNGRIERMPETLLAQLAPGGRLVAIMGSEAASKARLLTKIDSTLQDVAAFDATAPLLPGFEAKLLFTF